MKQEIKVVLGLMFGDEGKGNTVQWLCRQAINKGKSVAVVRFSGGPQAGHRVVNQEISHICSSYGAGSLLNVPTYWVNPTNTFIDPIAVMQERKELLEKGIDLYPQLPDNVRWITPYDVLANRINEKTLKDGSCGKGIFSTFKRYKEIVSDNPDIMLNEASEYWYIERDEYLDRLFKQSYYQLLSRQDNIPLSSYDVLIYEGSQGLLLDMDSPFYPNVTPSNVGLQTLTNVPIDEIYVCSRLYLTRHGNGYNPIGGKETMELFFNIEDVSNPYNQFQGTMKYGFLDLSLFDVALENLGMPTLVLTHCDTMKCNKVPYIENGRFCMDTFDDFVDHISTRFGKIIGSFSDRSDNYKLLRNQQR